MKTVTIAPEVYRALEQARDQVYRAHRHDWNFTGCGIGFRFRGGQRTTEPAVIAMVADKMPASAVARSHLLPKTVRVGATDYGVDVVECGPVVAAPDAAAGSPAGTAPESAGVQVPITGAVVPPRQGCSISAPGGDTGTLGCFVTDATDGTVCILSASRILANLGSLPVGTQILQPSSADAATSSPANPIATLKRYAPLDPADPANNTVDAAIAQLSNQDDYALDVVDQLMAPISGTHPAVGMVLATDGAGVNCFLCRMDAVVSKLGVNLIGGAGSVASPVVGTNIEKVGRSTGYTSSMIDATGVIIDVTYPSGETKEFYDLIWTQAFGLAGDYGAVACIGGNGHTYAVIPANCPLLALFESYYALPAGSSSDLNVLTNNLQDQFLAQSATGNLLINMVYLNSPVAINRLQTKQGPAYNQAAGQQFMQPFYEKYYALISDALANPRSSAVVTSQNIADFSQLLNEIGGPTSKGYEGLLSTGQNLDINSKSYKPSVSGVPELNGAIGLYFLLGTQGLGRTYQEFVAALNEESVYQAIYEDLSYIRTIEVPDKVSFD